MRSLLVLAAALVFCAGLASGQARRRPEPAYLPVNLPDQEEGAKILAGLRNIGLVGPYYQEFELRVLPRAGSETRLSGRWYGSRNASGPVARIEILEADGKAEAWIVQSGEHPAVWRMPAGGEPEMLEGSAAMAPLAGTNLTAADLQTPFMYWTDFVFEGRERFKGRPAYVFLLYPPESDRDLWPAVGGARILVDSQYEAPLKVQWVDDDGRALKTLSVLGLKNIEDRWIAKSFEARDETTRDKTRLVVTAVAFDVAIPGELFTPAGPGGAAGFAVPPNEIIPVP